MKSKKIIIGVMGPGEGADETDRSMARELGRLIADKGWIVLTGGRRAGVMHAALRGAKENRGTTIGILPGSDRSGMSEYVDIPVVTGMGEARNVVNILTADAVVACGMGAGTSSEISLAIKHSKPLVLLNTSPSARLFFEELGDDHIAITETPADAVKKLLNLLEHN